MTDQKPLMWPKNKLKTLGGKCEKEVITEELLKNHN